MQKLKLKKFDITKLCSTTVMITVMKSRVGISYSQYDIHRMYAIIIQCIWRKILAKRKLQRLKIANELEHLPNIGIKYFETKEHWYKNIT
jgi:hypothetical protein